MSLISRLLTRAGAPSGVTSLRPKGLAPLRREPAPAEEDAAPLRRAEEEEAAQPLRRLEEEEAAQPLRRMEEEPEAAPLRRAEAEEEEAQPLRRMEEEDAAAPLRREEEEEARPLRRLEEEEAAPLRRAEEEEPDAAPLRRAETEEAEDVQPLRRLEEEEDAAPLRRMEEEEAQTLRRLTPPDGHELTAENSPAPDELSGADDRFSSEAAPLRREAPIAPPAAQGEAPAGADGFPAPFRPPQFFSEPAQAPLTRPEAPQPQPQQGAERAKVVIDQVDVVIHEPAQPAASARSAEAEFARFARRRHLGGL